MRTSSDAGAAPTRMNKLTGALLHLMVDWMWSVPSTFLTNVAAAIVVCMLVSVLRYLVHEALIHSNSQSAQTTLENRLAHVDLTRRWVNGVPLLLDAMAYNRVMRAMQDWEPRVTYHEEGLVGADVEASQGRGSPLELYCIHHGRRKVDEYESGDQVWICSHDECIVHVPQQPMVTEEPYPLWDCTKPQLPRFSVGYNVKREVMARFSVGYNVKLEVMDKIWIVVTPDAIPSNLQPLRKCKLEALQGRASPMDMSQMVGRVPNVDRDVRLHSVAFLNSYDSQVCWTRLVVPACLFRRARRHRTETLSTHLQAALYDLLQSDLIQFEILPFLV
jgi:hypothetical protein